MSDHDLNLDIYETPSFSEPRIGAIPLGWIKPSEEPLPREEGTRSASPLNLDIYEAPSFSEPRIGAIPLGWVDSLDEDGEGPRC